MKLNADVVIVGSGVAGLFSALNLPEEQEIILITKSDLESSDSFLAQGGICVLRDEKDYDSYFEDTMKAGHYENRKESVDIMIRNSRDIINDLVKYGVEFEKKDGKFAYTREGAHSRPRILFHEDVTGKEITSKLLAQVKKLENVKDFSLVMSPLPFQIDCRNLHFISVIFPDHSISELHYSVGHVFDRIIMCNHNNRIAISLIDRLDQFQNFL